MIGFLLRVPQSLKNLRQPMPLQRKVKLACSNILYKVRFKARCCGHPGHPGC